jgi:TatD DNase family protein
VTGVLHCFTGGDALMDEALEAGWYVSFSGIVTFRRFDGADQVRRVPIDRLLIETDSPYLAPVPRRGRRNEPAYVAHTAAVIAEILGRTTDEVAGITAENAARFYGLPPADASP